MKFFCSAFLLLCLFANFAQGQESSAVEDSAIYVVGDVIYPSEIKFEEGLTLMEAIAIAGGISAKHKGNIVQIFRKISGKTVPEKIEINLKQIKTGKAEDLILQPFDIIEVSSNKRTPRGFYEIKTPNWMFML
jgi:polysaccharide export outer membrane protein